MTREDLTDGLEVEGPEGYAIITQEGRRFLLHLEDGTSAYTDTVALAAWKPVVMSTRLFFYGTLMSREGRGHYLGGLADPVGPASIRGTLYDVCGMFPALVEDGSGVAHGEVWQVRPGCLAAALRITDRIESFDADWPSWSLYLRELRPLLADPAARDDCGRDPVWVYVWNGTGLGAAVPGGRWRSPTYERTTGRR